MGNVYKDTDKLDDTGNGLTWATAKKSQEAADGVAVDGDTIWVQGAAEDTKTGSITNATGSNSNPLTIIGVADGTTNEPPLVSDYAVTKPVLKADGGGADITFAASHWINMSIHIADNLFCLGKQLVLTDCILTMGDDVIANQGTKLILHNTDFDCSSVIGGFGSTEGSVEVVGGTLLTNTCVNLILGTNKGPIRFDGFNLSVMGTKAIANAGAGNSIDFFNCKIPSAPVLYSSVPAKPSSSVTIVASDNLTTRGDTASIRDYMYEDIYGTIDSDIIQVRTGGADDGASGGFSYAMTPRANYTLESSSATLTSPWMNVWVAAGAQTLAVHISNDGGIDYLEDEVWIEVLTPNSNDQANHELQFFPVNERFFTSVTAITDDAVSVWGGTAANGQRLDVPFTAGFEGIAKARLHLAKRQATPDTLFLDPEPQVS